MTKRLSEKSYWEQVYSAKNAECKNWKSKVVLGQVSFAPLLNYSDYLIWEKLLPRFLSMSESCNVIEIGSAPGYSLVKTWLKFGYEPFGVEYTRSGAEINRSTFAHYGISPDNVIEADFFSNTFQSRFKGFFDLVMSFGFLEHFENPEDVVGAHLNLVADGGIVVVVIPNLSGINKWLANFFDSSILDIHNTQLMNVDAFSKLFDSSQLEKLFCGYYGTFHFGMFVARNPIKKAILCACKFFQIILSALFLLFLGGKGRDSRAYSPYLIFIGRKKQ